MKSHLRQLDIIVCGASADIIYMCVRHAHAGVTRKRRDTRVTWSRRYPTYTRSSRRIVQLRVLPPSDT